MMTTAKAWCPHCTWEGSAKVTQTNVFQVGNFCFVSMSRFPFITKSVQRGQGSVGSKPSTLFEKTFRFKVYARQRSFFSLLQSLQKLLVVSSKKVVSCMACFTQLTVTGSFGFLRLEWSIYLR